MQLRARLVPYTYTVVLEAYASDVPFLRGTYVDPPYDEQLFTAEFQNQYFFGDRFVITPVVTPMSQPANISTMRLYLPALSHAWVNYYTGQCERGQQILTRNFTLGEYGAYVKGGSMIPTTRARTCRWGTSACDETPSLLGAAQDIPAAIVWEIFFGNATAGGGTLAEDSGNGTEYMGGSVAVATTAASYVLVGQQQRTLQVTVGAVTNSQPSTPDTRTYEFLLRNVLTPLLVNASVGRSATRANPRARTEMLTSSFTWDPQTLTARVVVEGVSTRDYLHVLVELSVSPCTEVLCGTDAPFPGTYRRVRDIKQAIDEDRPATLPSLMLNRVDETVNRLRNSPRAAMAELQTYAARVREAMTLHANTVRGAPSVRIRVGDGLYKMCLFTERGFEIFPLGSGHCQKHTWVTCSSGPGV